ncbi:MAG: glycosyl transferase family 1, partial [Azorhizobium sp. 35-67-15]
INDFPGAVILVSHDRHLLEACAERLWVVGGGTVKPYDGDLDQYRREVLSKSNGRMTGDGKKERIDGLAPAEEAAELGPLRKRLKDVEAQVAKIEKDIAGVDKRLADPKIEKFPNDAARLNKQRGDLVDALAQAEEEWIAVSADLEALAPAAE